jgi:LPS export ABC transporter protein LptC
MRKRIQILIAYALFLFVGLFGCNSDNQSTSMPESKTTAPMPDQEAWNSVIKATTNGQLRAVVNYGHMSRFSQRKVVNLDQGIRVVFYDSNGKETSVLTAGRGEMDETSNDMSAFDHVVVVSDSGITLHTEQLLYSDQKNCINSKTNVMLTKPEGDILYGTGFTSDPQMNHYRLFNPHGVAAKSVDLSYKSPEKNAAADSVAQDSSRVNQQ